MRFVIPVLLLLSCLPHASFGQQYIVTVKPIQVRMDDGTLDAGMGYFPAVPISVEATNKIYAQAGITVEFLPTVFYDEMDFLVIDSSAEFQDLSLAPGHGQHADPLVINMWFVQEMQHCPPPGPCSIYLSWISANGVAVMGEYVDILFVVAHVMGYDFGLRNSGSEDLPREILMHVGLYSPQSLDDIYPDGLYSMARAGHVELEIYDLAGRRVMTQVNEYVSAGEHQVHWNGRDSAGGAGSLWGVPVPAQTGDYIETRRMVLVR